MILSRLSPAVQTELDALVLPATGESTAASDTISSSEVAAMIEGVLHHCTTLEVERAYTDLHGQSDVAFAFTRLLGFEILPRLSGLHAQKST